VINRPLAFGLGSLLAVVALRLGVAVAQRWLPLLAVLAIIVVITLKLGGERHDRPW
jgi:hypothetical protein